MKQYAKNEINWIKKYEQQGYIDTFIINDKHLIDVNKKTKYSPNEVYIVEEHRFEGMSDPSDMSILYVLESNDDSSKGTYLMAYGPTADIEIAEFFKDIPKANYIKNMR